MLAVVSRLFFDKNIVRRFLRNFADNFTNIKVIFSGDFPLIWKYLNIWKYYSNQFRYLISKCPDHIQSEERADRKKEAHEERTDNIYYKFL